MKRFLFYSLFLVSLSIVNSYAVRPFTSNDAYVVSEKIIELSGGTYSNSHFVSSYLCVETGISSKSSIYFSFPFTIKPKNTTENIEFGIKFNFLNLERYPKISISISSTPSQKNYYATIIASYTLINLNLHLNYGYIHPEGKTPFSIAAEYSINKLFNFLLETSVDNTKYNSNLYFLAGIRISPTNNFSIDFAINTDINSNKIPVYITGIILDI